VLLPSKLCTITDLTDWSKGGMLQQDYCWSLSPTGARQAFTTAALAWAESPLDSSHLFIIVPRVMRCNFGCVNCHIIFIGQFDPKELTFLSHPCCVPLLLFYLPPHRRSLVTQPFCRLDLPAFPRMPPWVAWQVAYMCGLL
jgi:hypothetical protein